MSTYHGRGGVVRDGTNNIGKIQNWEFEESAETAATDSMGDTHRTRVIDLIDATGAVTFVYDDADTGQNALGVGLGGGDHAAGVFDGLAGDLLRVAQPFDFLRVLDAARELSQIFRVVKGDAGLLQVVGVEIGQ